MSVDSIGLIIFLIFIGIPIISSIISSIKEEIYSSVREKVKNEIENQVNNENISKLEELNNYKISLDDYKNKLENFKKEIKNKVNHENSSKLEELNNYKISLDSYKNKLENLKKEIENQVNYENSSKLEELNNYKISLDNYKNELENYKKEIVKISTDTSLGSPWLAQRYADYFQIIDTNRINYLLNKNRPAPTSAEIVKQIKNEKKKLLMENKILEYQQNALFDLFPWLEDAIQLDVNELKNEIDSKQNKEAESNYDSVREFLSPIEYQKLSDCEKYQLALDRYLHRKKSLWQIGISYERYIGYVYEMKNYKVLFNGAVNGLADLGRDLIAENNDEILIIQCKYWKKERIIRENTVFQLYGTMILKKIETEKQIKGILITTSSLSDEAKQIAKYLNIQVKENILFNKTYPCIKCNINKLTKEKIYHLPFDQQYDRIQINIKNGERYISTVKEAEALGFRRAMKHLYT